MKIQLHYFTIFSPSIKFFLSFAQNFLAIFLTEYKVKLNIVYLKVMIFYPSLLTSSVLIIGNLLFMDFTSLLLVSDHPSPSPRTEMPILRGYMTNLSTALSLATFEPNPEYLYLYRLERKI